MKRSQAKTEASSSDTVPHVGVPSDELVHDDEVPVMKGYERIIEKVFRIDPDVEFEAVRQIKFLQPAHRMSLAELRDALADADDMSARAFVLYIHARAAQENADFDAGLVMAELRSAALVGMKGDGIKITEDGIEAWIKTHFTTAARAAAERKVKNRKTVELIEHLAALWKARHRSLEALVNTVPR